MSSHSEHVPTIHTYTLVAYFLPLPILERFKKTQSMQTKKYGQVSSSHLRTALLVCEQGINTVEPYSTDISNSSDRSVIKRIIYS